MQYLTQYCTFIIAIIARKKKGYIYVHVILRILIDRLKYNHVDVVAIDLDLIKL